MNIIFLSQIVPYPPHGGVLQRGFNIVKEISRYNNVHLIAFVHPDTLKTDREIDESKAVLEKYCKSVDYFPLWPKKSGVHRFIALTMGVFYPGPFSALAHRSHAVLQKMRTIVERNRIDLIHYDTIGLAPYRRYFQDIPSVLTHHNIESHLMRRRAKVEKSFFGRAYVAMQAQKLESFEKLESPKFDINVMMSKIDEAELLALTKNLRTTIVPNGVDTEYFQPSYGANDNAVIYTGGLNMFANRDAVMYFLREIWPRVKSEIPDAKFYVVGQDPTDDLLQAAAKDRSVIVTGYVDDIRPLVAKASVYIVPIRVGGGTRLKVLDAMAQGKAIVSTTVGCEGISVNHGKNIIVADSDEGFAANVVSLFRAPHERDRLGRAARNLAESSYSWTKIANQLQDAYELVTKECPGLAQRH